MTDGAPTPAAPTADAPPPRRRAAWTRVAFAVAALASCWNPLAAPFGAVVGVAAVVLAIRALRRERPRRRADALALALGLLAAVASAVVIALTAGAVGIDLPGQPVVKGRSAAELDQVLSGAGERTRARRERAREELDQSREGAAPAAPGASAPPRPGVGTSPDEHRP